ncbi:hypothetical protein MP228_004151 [Amoeboaphelidium protococcarum]|nr:hypothetical protein MP228_004151 [Amoeboaphelidium protococcarum]
MIGEGDNYKEAHGNAVKILLQNLSEWNRVVPVYQRTLLKQLNISLELFAIFIRYFSEDFIGFWEHRTGRLPCRHPSYQRFSQAQNGHRYAIDLASQYESDWDGILNLIKLDLLQSQGACSLLTERQIYDIKMNKIVRSSWTYLEFRELYRGAVKYLSKKQEKYADDPASSKISNLQIIINEIDSYKNLMDNAQ